MKTGHIRCEREASGKCARSSGFFVNSLIKVKKQRSVRIFLLGQKSRVSMDQRTGEPVVNNSATQTARPPLHPDEVRFGLKPDEMLLFADKLPGVLRAQRNRISNASI